MIFLVVIFEIDDFLMYIILISFWWVIGCLFGGGLVICTFANMGVGLRLNS